MTKFLLTNTMSGKKEMVDSIHGKKITMYICGITPYDYPHMGHGRCYVVFDFLYRFLTFLGYQVSYCRNFTDIDDKILDRAELELQDRMQYATIAHRYMVAFNEDMQALNCKVPEYQPLVTETIPEIITFIEGLIKKGRAYVAGGDVYYSIASFPEYGKLSKRNIDDLCAGARVEINELKKSPYDFALWKKEPDGFFWKSPWGYGRPGWHIECSAMANKFFGPQLDLHGGGMDLIFPHHENEIAQSEGLFEKQFARYWMHIAFITMNKEKMSKSVGNFFTLREVLKHFDPMTLRYYFLTHYFRAPLDFSFDDLEVAQKSYQRICKALYDHQCASCEKGAEYVKQSPIIQSMLAMLSDDLNMSGMFAIVFENLGAIKENEQDRCALKWFFKEVLGFTLEPIVEKKPDVTPEIEKLIAEREQARKEKNWARADALRDKLKALGFEVQDKKSK